MSSLVERLRVRSDRKPVYNIDDWDDGEDLDLKRPGSGLDQQKIERIVRDDAACPLNDIEKILDCEMRPTAADDSDASKQIFMKQYLVKWKGLSYLHCTWVSEKDFVKAYKALPRLRTKVNNFHRQMSSINNSEDEFVAIRPEWTTVDRILACRGGDDDEKEYLVKWKELSYDECYWEFESDISSFQQEIERFYKIQSRRRKQSSSKQKSNTRDATESKKKQKEFQHFEHSPGFLSGGKTIQSIAFLASLFEDSLCPHIVVAPLSTLRNWEREFALWAPQMNVIVDEGHRLKNKDSKLFSSLKQYSSKHRVLLTGTPLQNNLDELFMLMHFLDAGKFASLEEFQEEFKDINQEEQISRLHKMLAPHLLRRVKKDVMKELPPKKELILRVDLSSKQKEYYKAILTRNYEILTRKGGAQISLINVVMELRKLCCHPYMLEGVEPEIEDPNESFKQLLESAGKLNLLDKMMVKLREQGHRVLIYSQFQHMLDLLEDYCRYKKWQYERIDGKVGGAERQIRIDRFNAKNSSRFCFLLSTRAGGLGINLATADTVIIYDSDWNPHADLQAMARAHRLGQTNKVMIFRLITRGTIEERMMQMTKKKMVLEHLVVGRLKAQNINQEELDDIIRYGSKELFADENDEAGKSRQIHYDDAAINRLLDREQVGDEEANLDDAEEDGFLKAFKVANFEYIDEVQAAAEEQARKASIENTTTYSERANYWEDLLKDKYEVNKVEEFNAMGKGKRSRKQTQQLRFGVGQYDWAEFTPRMKQKTYEEIKEYGTLFLSHIAEDITDSPTFSDGVPKEGLRILDVLVRLAELMMIRDKVKFAAENPSSPLFADDVVSRLPTLKSGRFWKEHHDLSLLRAVLKHGYGRWQAIVDDKDLRVQELICQELNLPFITLPVPGASQAQDAANIAATETPANQTKETGGGPDLAAEAAQGAPDAPNRTQLYPDSNTLYHFREMQRRQVEFVKKRVLLLEKALNAELQKEAFGQENTNENAGGEPEAEVRVVDIPSPSSAEIDAKASNHLPQVDVITPEEISVAVCDDNPDRVEMAQLYNKQNCSSSQERKPNADSQLEEPNKIAGDDQTPCPEATTDVKVPTTESGYRTDSCPPHSEAPSSPTNGAGDDLEMEEKQEDAYSSADGSTDESTGK
ncbi:hypothetical protein RHMOL_Rhmol02G0259700 [Rhododendron molle]|uniref:Uncharacterized protein n=1 Tax=Rhododendron molle TaxID=49168 RepID=A0ACC0PTX0_RHOML|nr:hypothetical protein RHMOL_Rhmol02G0259700 [Rhododendron molle]